MDQLSLFDTLTLEQERVAETPALATANFREADCTREPVRWFGEVRRG